MAFNFLHGCVLNQRALGHAVFKAITHFQRFDFGSKFFDKLVIHLVLHVNAVRANTGLSCIAVLAGHRAFDCTVDIRIVKHDERRIATEFKCEFFNAGRRLRHQNATHFGGACEADMAHRIAGAKHFAHSNAVVAVRCQDVQHARRNARAHGQLGGSQCG